jgi:hypothetical protein
MSWLNHPVAEDAVVAAAFAIGMWYFGRQMMWLFGWL